MARRSLHDRRVLLTGASSGIGRAVALELAAQRTRLILVARSEQPLVDLAEECRHLGAASAEPYVGDISDVAVRANLADAIRTRWQALDLLINNAGISAHGRFAESTLDVLRQIMEVNFFAATELVRETRPLLAAGNDALLVNIGSILGHRGVPYNSEYCASKFALRGWSEAVRPELARDGIELLLVSPGTTDTEFFDHLISKRERLPWKQSRGIPAEKAAQQIVRAMQSRRHEIYPNRRGRMLVLLNRAAPWLVDRVMNRYR